MSAVALLPRSSTVAPAPTLAVAAGRNLIAAGAIFGSANLFQYGVVAGVLQLHPAVLSLSWPVAVALFLTVLFRLRRHGGEGGRRTTGWARMAVLTQVAAAGALAGLSALTGDWSLMLSIPVVGMAIYGVAWTVAALRGRHSWMAMIALGCFGCAASIVMRLGTADQYLTYAVGLFTLVLTPGLALASGRLR